MKQKEKIIAKIVSSIERVIANNNVIYQAVLFLLDFLPPCYQSPHGIITREIKKLLISQNNRPLTFVQIGCYDGKTGDPLYPFIVNKGWSGILVEPFPKSFHQLTETYKECVDLCFENMAIADHDGTSILYWSNQPTKKFWHDQTFSLVNSHHKTITHLADDKHQLEIEVPSSTVYSLLKKYNIHELDIFCVDVEGYDDKVITQLLETEVTPRLIIYESSFLNEDVQNKIIAMLFGKGYRITETTIDTIAVLEK